MGSTQMQRLKVFVQEHPTAVGIGLVGAALVAVLVAAIAFGGLLRSPATADASATPTGSAQSSPTEAATTEPSASSTFQPTTWDGYQLIDVATPLFNSVWARVTVDELNVRRAGGSDAHVVGKLAKGDLVLITGDFEFDGDREWAPMVAEGLGGWVAVGEPGVAYLQPVATPWLFGSERVLEGVVSTGDRFLAYGWARDRDVQPYEGSGQSALAYVSDDGRTWSELTNVRAAVVAAAAGPAGFVIVTQPAHLGPTMVQRSDDGSTWTEGPIVEVQSPSAAWGPAGPIVLGMDFEAENARIYRIDGASQEPIEIPTEFSQPQVEASNVGYVMFDRYGATTIAVSVDAVSWNSRRVPGIEFGQHMIRDVELVGNRLVVVASGTDSGDAVLRSGVMSSDGRVTWADGGVEGLQDVTVDSVSARPDGTLLASGWDRQELLPRVWRSTDGRSWRDLSVDATTFGGAIGPEPVFGAGVWVGTGGDSLYTSPSGADWSQTLGPLETPVDGPGCPPADQVTALDLLFLSSVAADCYRDTPLTVTAWAPLIDGLGGCCYPEGVPAWLNSPIPLGWVSSGPSSLSGSMGVFPLPGTDGELGTDDWVRITGHFHDAAAQDCRRIPLTYFPHRIESVASIIDDCLHRFVVDRIVPSDAP